MPRRLWYFDINPKGGSEIIRDRAKGLFSELEKRKAETCYEITNHESMESGSMVYGVVDFDQFFFREISSSNLARLRLSFGKR